MKKNLLFLLFLYSTLSVYSQNKSIYNTDSIKVNNKVDFFIYDGPYGQKENIKEPAVKFILTIKNLGTKPIPDIDVSNRSQYVNLFINDSLNNPLSLYNGIEMPGDHLLNKGDSDTYTWWIFERDAYSEIFTVQWQYMDLYTEKFKINMTKKVQTSDYTNNQSIETEECGNLYPFDNYYINLDENSAELIDAIHSTDFKTCSKYAHRFANPISDSVNINGKSFVVENNKKEGIYNLNLFDSNKLIHTIKLPVENPLPEVHEYYIHLLPYKNSVIMFMEDMYTTHYTICKYDTEGKELIRKRIEHTYITHPNPNENYHHRYLYFNYLTATQMVFASHIAFADTFKTIVLSMDDFAITEYDKTANGLILDENEESLLGFVSENEEHFTVQMIDNTKYEFEIKYGNPACDFILKDNLLYIANYHPIATGSSLHCFDLNSKEMKWTAEVKQINASHSQYSNKVILSIYKDKIIMEGNEANGDYVQIFDCETGKRLAVFGDFLEISE